MKRISIWFLALACSTSPGLLAQDAATEERLNKLRGDIENLVEGQRAQEKRIESLAREVEALREQLSKPTGNYASPEDLKRLAEAIKDVDRKRMEDAERVSAQVAKLGQTLSASPSGSKKNRPAPTTPENSTPEKGLDNEKGYPYTIAPGDTLSAIVQAYREKNIKVTTEQILKANPGLRADKLKPGQKIWIPAPQS